MSIKKPDCLITAKEFFESASFVFQKYKLKAFAGEKEFHDYIANYSFPMSINQNGFIDTNILSEKLKLIWHAVAGTQAELANFLIFFSQFDSQRPENDINTLTRTLCSHHLSMTYESIYRVWEKITHVLYYLHYKDINKTIYYNEMINRISLSGLYDISVISDLKSQVKNWDKIAEIRNKYSHEASRLFLYEYTTSVVLNKYGFPYSFEEKSTDFKQECCALINRYKQLLRLNQILRNFISAFPSTLIKTHI